MREIVVNELSAHLSPELAEDLISSYECLLSGHKLGDLKQALLDGGRFVEHVFRILEYLRTGSVPSEIKAVQSTMQKIENATSLDDSLRLMIPRAAYGMIYNIRNKRNAIHVKEIDPSPIDTALCVSAASWIVAEFLRLYHNSANGEIEQIMGSITRTSIPLIEAIEGEVFVNTKVPPRYELLLLLAHNKPTGMTRTELGTAKCAAPAVTTAIQALCKERLAHQTSQKRYFVTGPGETSLAKWLTDRTKLAKRV